MTKIACSVKQLKQYNDPYDIIQYLKLVELSKFKFFNLEVGPFERLLPLADCEEKIEPLTNYINNSVELRCICLHAPYITNFYFGETTVGQIEQYENDLIKSIQICNKLKSKYMVIHLGTIKDTNNVDEFFNSNFAVLNKALDLAKRLKITICVENHTNFYGQHSPTATELNYFCEQCSKKGYHVSECFDFGHANISGEGLNAINKLEYIKVYHLHDNDGQSDLHNELWHGNINWDSYRKFFTQDKIMISEVRYRSHKCLSKKLNVTFANMLKLVK